MDINKLLYIKFYTIYNKYIIIYSYTDAHAHTNHVHYRAVTVILWMTLHACKCVQWSVCVGVYEYTCI